MIPKNERWKAIVIICLVVVGAVAIWLRPLHLGLDLQGGTSILLEAETRGGELGSSTMEQLVGVMERRVNQLGLSESVVQRRGSNRVAIELPGFKDQDAAVEALGKTAMLTMSDVDGNVVLTGNDLKDATLSRDQYGRPAVSVTLRPDGSRKFATFTRDNVGRPIVMKLDDEVLSTPVIQEPITDGKGQISGSFTVQQASEMAALLRAGALPVPVKVVEARTVGPSLGQVSIEQSLRAVIIGLVGTVLFMLLVYRGLGLVAALALVIYAVLVTGAMMGLGAVLTLPGIAGLVLSIGMAVDGNVLVFERAREEFLHTNNVFSALRKGFERAFTAIFDSNATTFLAAVILFLLSVGSVRGFAITLGLGVLASFLTAITASRIIAYLLAGTSLGERPGAFGLTCVMKSRRWDIVGKRKVWFSLSGILILVSLISLVTQGLNFGLDFAGGTVVEMQVNETLSLAQIEDYAGAAGIENVVVQPSANSFVLKGTSIPKENVASLVAALDDAGLEAEVIRQEFVGPTVGKEVREKALLALLIALVGQVIYVSIRFEWRFALAAVVALFHDVFLLVGLFSLLQREVDSTFLAALLTVIGYSVNDTIVIFDRVRESRRLKRNQDFTTLVNDSINETMSRSLNTGAAVLIVLGMLLLIGGNTLDDFALALFVGVILGTYSSVCNAGPLVALWHDGVKKPHRKAA